MCALILCQARHNPIGQGRGRAFAKKAGVSLCLVGVRSVLENQEGRYEVADFRSDTCSQLQLVYTRTAAAATCSTAAHQLKTEQQVAARHMKLTNNAESKLYQQGSFF